MAEMDSYVDSVRKRIPDLTYLTADQRQAIRRGERVNTLFAIEILSDSEKHQDVLDKIQDYFNDGTQLVWYIVPKLQKIYAYSSPDESIVFREFADHYGVPRYPRFSIHRCRFVCLITPPDRISP